MRNDKFVGMTFALVDIVLPAERVLPWSAEGFAFAPATLQLVSGGFFQQRYMKI